MIELRIDNRPVAIDDISIELVAYNPLADESADLLRSFFRARRRR